MTVDELADVIDSALEGIVLNFNWEKRSEIN